MLNELGVKITEINKANGWNLTTLKDWDDDYKITAIVALITTECAEAIEGHRDNDFDNFKEELADIIIRTLDLSTGLKIDIDAEISKKLEKNKNRGFKHGGKRI